MASLTDCPSAAVLRAIATGGIQEPVLGVYLEHLEHCETCCAHVDSEGAAVPRMPVGGGAGAGGSDDSTPAPRADWLTEWVEHLTRAIPSEADVEVLGVGHKVGPFRIVGVLGEGASAVVYEAVDEELGRLVVLKVLRSIHADDPGRRSMVIEEARALAAVQHQAVMPLLQLLWFEGSPVLVFPRLPGETLAAMLAAGIITWQATLRIVQDVARGLDHAHGMGVFHYDVKPTNIWLHRPRNGGRTQALLFDFGLTGGLAPAVGTPGYSDPDPRPPGRPETRDLFSLGVVLHECLESCASVPPGCRELVRRLTTDRVTERPTARAVVAAVDRLLDGGDRRRARWASAGIAGAACFLVALSAWGVSARRAAGPIAATMVVAPHGLPVALTANGDARAFVDDESRVLVHSLAGERQLASVPLDFRPDQLALTADASRLAAANASGDLAIVDVETGSVVGSHHFPDGVSSIDWAGWERDAVAVLSGRQVYAFCGRRRKASVEDLPDQWILQLARDDVVRVASQPNSEAMVSVDDVGTITSWSFGNLTEDVAVGMPRIMRDGNAADVFGWKASGVAFVARGDQLLEMVPLQPVKPSTIVAPARGIVWLTDTHYVVLTPPSSADGSRLLWGDLARPGWRRELDVAGADIERIELNADRDQVAAITREGGVRLYRLAP